MPETVAADLLNGLRSVHFIGIGGIGMSGLARAMLHLGVRVSGSDGKPSAITAALEAAGARVAIGHKPENLEPKPQLVVYSSAIRPENPEFRRAVELDLPLVRRAKLLAALMHGRRGIAVTGAHGKTTTSAMAVAILDADGTRPSFLIGGELLGEGSNARLNDSPVVVVEADESDASFLDLRPELALVTNIDREHLDFYGDLAAIENAVRLFIGHVAERGGVILNADDARLLAIFKGQPAATNLRLYGVRSVDEIERALAPAATRAVPYTWGKILDAGRPARFELVHFASLGGGPQSLGEVSLEIGGSHNVSNAAGAAALGMALGASAEAIVQGLSRYPGVARRCQPIGRERGVAVIDDYAHHPNEIRALLASLSSEVRRQGEGRVWAVFQPHRFSRFRDLFDEFVDAFGDADRLWVLPTYAAGEPAPDTGATVDTDRFVTAMRDRHGRHVDRAESPEAASESLSGQLSGGDVVVTVGAGDVNRVGRLLLERLRP
jgi:UDP-N-acetylmuramate--alanine ligase